MSGKLVMNALVMYDYQTDSLWSHFTGDAIKGDYLGTRLELVPSTHTTWGRWKELHPDTLALDPRATADLRDRMRQARTEKQG